MGDTVLLAAGGTGGHVFPGLATAAALHDARPDLEIAFVGTADRLEARLVPEAGWPLHTVPAMALRKDLSALKLPVVLGRAVSATRQLIRQSDVIAAVCFGGYTSVPLALAARTTGTPLVVHEQNAVPGRANKLASRAAAAVAVTFEQAADGFGSTRTVLTGNPVRPGLLPDAAPGEDLVAVRARLRDEALSTFGLRPDRRTLLVFGGSHALVGRGVVEQRLGGGDQPIGIHVGIGDDDRTAGCLEGPAVGGLVVVGGVGIGHEDRRQAERGQLGDRGGAGTADDYVGRSVGEVHARDELLDDDVQAAVLDRLPGGDRLVVGPGTSGVEHLQLLGPGPAADGAGQRPVDLPGALAAAEDEELSLIHI